MYNNTEQCVLQEGPTALGECSGRQTHLEAESSFFWMQKGEEGAELVTVQPGEER